MRTDFNFGDEQMQNDHITLAELHESSEFKSLTTNQQRWFDIYAASGDPRAAVIEAYPRAKKLGQNYQSQLTQKLLSAPRVRAVLAQYWQWDAKQIFLSDLDAQIRRAKSADRAPLLALKARVMLGIDAPTLSAIAAESDQAAYPLGATLEQDGRIYHVEAVEVTR